MQVLAARRACLWTGSFAGPAGSPAFRPALVDGRVTPLRDELRWLQGVLGRCRDWDVFNAKNVFPLRDRLAEDRRIARFGVLCAQAREDAYDDLDRVVAGRRYRTLQDELQALLGDGAAVATPADGKKLRKFSARRLKKRRKSCASRRRISPGCRCASGATEAVGQPPASGDAVPGGRTGPPRGRCIRRVVQ